MIKGRKILDLGCGTGIPFDSFLVGNDYQVTGVDIAENHVKKAREVFVQGLERVGEDELTWQTYMEAMEEDPINNPFGGIVDFSDGNRVGTQAMSWLEATASQNEEDEWTYDWATVRDIQDISEILN